MAFLDGLKTNLYQRSLRQQLDKKRPSKVRSFEHVQTIGILFDADREEDRAIVLNYRNILRREHRKDVMLLGYHDLPEPPESSNYTCFCRKDLNFSQTPTGDKVMAFIKMEFHWLLALHVHDCPPLEYIAAASEAEFRVGHYREGKTDFYDWMLHNKSNSLRAFLQQIDDYRSKIS